MQRMFLTVSNFPLRETGSKKALYFIHNDIPKLSPLKYFGNRKKTKFIMQPSSFVIGRYLQPKFEMLKIIITIIKNKKQTEEL